MKQVAIAVLFVLALASGVSTKADSCADCQTLTVLETLTHFTVVGAPTTVEWFFLDSPANFEVIDTWQGGMFSGDLLSSHMNIGVPSSINLGRLSLFTDTNTGVICCSSCPPGTPVTLEPSFPGGEDVPACFDPYVHVYEITLESGLILSAGLKSSFIPETPGTFNVPEPATISLILVGFFFVMLGIIFALSLHKRSSYQLHKAAEHITITHLPEASLRGEKASWSRNGENLRLLYAFSVIAIQR